MEKTLDVINEMKNEGVIKDYAIGGGIAVMFHTEPFVTIDIDFMFLQAAEEKDTLAPLSTIYEYLTKKKGYEMWKEYIMIEGIPVQFIPASHDLEAEAVINADDTTYENAKTRVIKPEYMIAIYLRSDRTKDRLRIEMLLEQANIDENLLEEILKRYGLYEKFIENRGRHYGQ